MATVYRITYAVLPASLGPDDYEPSDLETHTDLVELSDPEHAGKVAGQAVRYAPPHSEVKNALRGLLEPGAEPIILKLSLADDA
ncbi:hypothetical protein [Streptomyces sp. NPDC056549]|uniref:hypothetical protein n=1 Tax=Streptomyces sp. NPDC056549 TaxID=3345864 RepID=UPI00368C452F